MKVLPRSTITFLRVSRRFVDSATTTSAKLLQVKRENVLRKDRKNKRRSVGASANRRGRLHHRGKIFREPRSYHSQRFLYGRSAICVCACEKAAARKAESIERNDRCKKRESSSAGATVGRLIGTGQLRLDVRDETAKISDYRGRSAVLCAVYSDRTHSPILILQQLYRLCQRTSSFMSFLPIRFFASSYQRFQI